VGVTQEDLAGKLGVQQAAVSRLERREDITLSSLKRYVAAIGAELEISVRMANGEQVRLASTGGSKRERATCGHVARGLSATDAPLTGPPMDGWISECRTWLAESGAIAKGRWPRAPELTLRVADYGEETGSEGDELASSDVSRSEIRIGITGVWGLGKYLLDLDGRTCVGTSLANVARAVGRTLIGHEVGHFVVEHASDDFLSRFSNRELRADAVSGWLAGRVADDAALGSMIVSQLGCRVATCSHPTPDERSYAYLVGHLEGTRERQQAPG
jgi:transcriptional regulator with XRE-family HTH domain